MEGDWAESAVRRGPRPSPIWVCSLDRLPHWKPHPPATEMIIETKKCGTGIIFFHKMNDAPTPEWSITWQSIGPTDAALSAQWTRICRPEIFLKKNFTLVVRGRNPPFDGDGRTPLFGGDVGRNPPFDEDHDRAPFGFVHSIAYPIGNPSPPPLK